MEILNAALGFGIWCAGCALGYLATKRAYAHFEGAAPKESNRTGECRSGSGPLPSGGPYRAPQDRLGPEPEPAPREQVLCGTCRHAKCLWPALESSRNDPDDWVCLARPIGRVSPLTGKQSAYAQLSKVNANLDCPLWDGTRQSDRGP